MRIITHPDRLPASSVSLARGCILTVGNFDGVHLGHQSLLRRTAEKALAACLPAIAVTFDPHPLRVIQGAAAPPLLMSLPRKLRLLDALGMDLALVLSFSAEVAASPPEDFVRDIFSHALHARELIIGYDYAFGRNRRGNADLLASLGGQYGFTLEQLDPVFFDGAIVSSTRIRNALLAGDPAAAARLLGRPHYAEGMVMHGSHRGGPLLGFPTANIMPSKDFLLPMPGVYAVLATLEDGSPTRQGVANVGRNPTFGRESFHLEAHLLDLDRDLYDQRLGIHFIRRLRDERRFPSVPELMEQIRRDAAQAREILENLPPEEMPL
ncbi:MAG: bifunctional riboflavin kinase/FAD synthetase [Desulfovibrio sp.]|jgi:riboflavin kinase/FMN adenylyltransferase|nr:bifunctional riboflavin kinase/FAD synthetase [Desulfovibrio sp.]